MGSSKLFLTWRESAADPRGCQKKRGNRKAEPVPPLDVKPNGGLSALKRLTNVACRRCSNGFSLSRVSRAERGTVKTCRSRRRQTCAKGDKRTTETVVERASVTNTKSERHYVAMVGEAPAIELFAKLS